MNDEEQLDEIMPWSKSLPENVYLKKIVEIRSFCHA